jgi:hypothetical protein
MERLRDTKLVKTLFPPGIAQKTLAGIGCKTREKILGKLLAPQVFEGFLIDDIVSMPGTKKFQKIDPAFALRTLKPSKHLIANVGTIPVLPPVTCSGLIDVDIGGGFQPN